MDENVFFSLDIFFLVIFGIESIVCLLGNGFIIVVNGYSWFQSRKMLPCDFLVTALSLSRFLLQWVSSSYQFLYFSSSETYLYSKMHQVHDFPWIYLNTASLLCSTWLSVFYCVKVTNFPHPMFAWLKQRIGGSVPRCLGVSFLVFVICSIPPATGYFGGEKCHNLIGNLSEKTGQSENRGIPAFPLVQVAFTAINFSICVSASVLLLVSLWRHRRNLKRSGLSTRDFSTQAHLSVMKPLLLLLVFYILNFAALVMALTNILQYGKLQWLISDIVLSLYPSAHSIILICTNPKLRKACIRVVNFRRSLS